MIGLGANTPDEAIYPTGLTDSTGGLLNGANDYRITFAPGEQPPAKYFWSLTVYDSNGYLTPNPIDRYSLGPSHPPLIEKPDGSIVIALQHDEPTEDDVNWLPTPERRLPPQPAALRPEQGGAERRLVAAPDGEGGPVNERTRSSARRRRCCPSPRPASLCPPPPRPAPRARRPSRRPSSAGRPTTTASRCSTCCGSATR